MRVVLDCRGCETESMVEVSKDTVSIACPFCTTPVENNNFYSQEAWREKQLVAAEQLEKDKVIAVRRERIAAQVLASLVDTFPQEAEWSLAKKAVVFADALVEEIDNG